MRSCMENKNHHRVQRGISCKQIQYRPLSTNPLKRKKKPLITLPWLWSRHGFKTLAKIQLQPA